MCEAEKDKNKKLFAYGSVHWKWQIYAQKRVLK
jgi:hypothetical protein